MKSYSDISFGTPRSRRCIALARQMRTTTKKEEKPKMKKLKIKQPLLLDAAAMFGIAVTSSLAQELPEKLPTKEDLAKDNKLFAELATKYLHWDEPTDPIHIVGPLYFVGTRGLSSWLFVTSEGNILLNTGTTLPQKGMQSGWVVQKQ